MYKYVRFPDFKFKALTLSYDDGVRQDKRLISIMQQHGLKGTFNINTGMFSAEYKGVENGRMTKQETFDLYNSSKMEVAMHGYHHFSMTQIDSALAISDILTDRKESENMFGKVINGMAYANGLCNEELRKVLSKIGISWARTAGQNEKFDLPENWLEWEGTCHHNNPRLMELAEKFVQMKEPGYYWSRKLQVFYLWGHSYEFDNDGNWEVIEKFAEYMGNQDDIWYATNGEIFDYLQACERIKFSADGNFVHNPNAIDIYIDYLNNKYIIPAGKTVKLG